MTLQEMYDTAARGIIGQGGPSIAKDGKRCLYRSDDGRKCAAGWLMADADYHKGFEGEGVFDVPAFCGLSSEKLNLLNDMQESHDFCDHSNFFSSWADRMRHLAARYNLDPSVLDEVPQ